MPDWAKIALLLGVAAFVAVRVYDQIGMGATDEDEFQQRVDAGRNPIMFWVVQVGGGLVVLACLALAAGVFFHIGGL
jgi:hypothetical protein